MCNFAYDIEQNECWVMFGITPKLKIVGQNVTDPTRQEIANTLRKFEPAIDVPVQYIEIPEREGFYVIAMYFNPPSPTQAPYHSMHAPTTRWRTRQQ